MTRFYIGANLTEPKVFGIYEKDGEFIVYKNKEDGSRAIRYQGTDEAYAVNELYQRLKEEIINQKQHKERYEYSYTPPTLGEKIEEHVLMPLLVFLGSVVPLAILLAVYVLGDSEKGVRSGYYKYNDNEYYYQNYTWYYYDDSDNDWEKVEDISDLTVHINANTYDDYRDYDYSGESFESSKWYDSGSNDDEKSWDSDSDSLWDSDDSWDSDSHWDSNDSWDSNDTDWNSDW